MQLTGVGRKRGVGVAEVIVVIIILSILLLLVVVSLAKSREEARLLTCQSNLKRIGTSMVLFDQINGRLPAVPTLPLDDPATAMSPLAVFLDRLGVSALSEVEDPSYEAPTDPLSIIPGTFAAERLIPGFVCPADPLATDIGFPAPLNYRANTGDQVTGENGPFAPGTSTSIARVEAADGASYTSAFFERLVGSAGRPDSLGRDYQLIDGSIPDGGCPEGGGLRRQVDAGRSWLEVSWRSTLGTHGVLPMSPTSCISADGLQGLMGASSGHLRGGQVLMLDGQVRVVTRTVDPNIWASMGNAWNSSKRENPGP